MEPAPIISGGAPIVVGGAPIEEFTPEAAEKRLHEFYRRRLTAASEPTTVAGGEPAEDDEYPIPPLNLDGGGISASPIETIEMTVPEYNDDESTHQLISAAASAAASDPLPPELARTMASRFISGPSEAPASDAYYEIMKRVTGGAESEKKKMFRYNIPSLIDMLVTNRQRYFREKYVGLLRILASQGLPSDVLANLAMPMLTELSDERSRETNSALFAGRRQKS
jgi:hypothetical protein